MPEALWQMVDQKSQESEHARILCTTEGREIHQLVLFSGRTQKMLHDSKQ